MSDSFRSESRTSSLRVALGIFRSILYCFRVRSTMQVAVKSTSGLIVEGMISDSQRDRLDRVSPHQVSSSTLRLNLMGLVHCRENTTGHHQHPAGQGECDHPKRRDSS